MPVRHGSAQADLQEAVHSVLASELDRRILLALCESPDALFWADLHRAAGSPSRQRFQDAIESLLRLVLVHRRLVAAGNAHRSLFTISPRGRAIASALLGLGREGSLPQDTPSELRTTFQSEFLAHA